MKKTILIGSLLIPLLFGCTNNNPTPTPTPSGGGDGGDTEPGGGGDPDPDPGEDVPYDLSGETTKNKFAGNANLVHVRFPLNNENQFQMGNEEEGFGVNWWQEGWEMNDDIENQVCSYARLVLKAPFTGEYNMSLQGMNFNLTYPLRVYVNSKNPTDAKDMSLTSSTAWSKDESTTPNFKVNLKKGKNVVLVQVNTWGAATSFTIPKEVEVIKAKGGLDGEYVGDDFIYQAAYPVAGTNILDPEAKFVYQPLKYDSSYSFEGAAILHFTPKATTKSLDVTYKIATKTSGAAGLTVRLGTNASNLYSFDLSDKNVGEELTVHVPSNVLTDMGFIAGTKTNLRLSSASGSLDILKVKESTQEDASDNKIIGVNDIRTYAVINGRNIYNESSIGLDWTASGIEFDITGGGDVYANLVEVADAFGQTNTSAGGTRFAVEVDHTLTGYVRPTSNTLLASNLTSAKHNIAIYKTSEAAGGLVDLMSLKVNKDATISKPTKDYKFQVLGDSFTCGNQISATEENGYLAFANQLGKSYNAQMDIVSVSGRGLMLGWNSEEGWAASWNNEIKDLWSMTSYFRDRGTAKDNHTDFIPDVVICNIGGNDLGDYVMQIAPLTIEEFCAQVVAFSQKLRTAYPSAKIIWGHGYYVNRNYETEYRAAVASLNDPNMDFIYFNAYGGGADGHANATQHAEMADIYSAKIASMLNVADPRA